MVAVASGRPAGGADRAAWRGRTLGDAVRRFMQAGRARKGPRSVLAVTLALLASATTISAAWAAAPANDAFDAPQLLSGPLPMTIPGTNVEATKQPGEPDHAGNPGGASVWYAWTPVESGDVTVYTCDGSFDTLLAVYSGDTLDGLTPTASNDDGCGLQSSVTFPAVAGTTYRIAVDGFNAQAGAFTLTIDTRLGTFPTW